LPAAGAGIQADEPPQQLIGEVEAVEHQQRQELVGHRGELVLPALADGVLPRPLREPRALGLLPQGRQPVGQGLELVERESGHPGESSRVRRELGKPQHPVPSL